MVPPPPVMVPEKAQQLFRKQRGRMRGKRSGVEQGMLPLEVVSKGRFDKSDPTIRDGEDLDGPTYIRRGIRLS
jgi:cell division protein FtsZ